MAKFQRHDPRNKKQNKQKRASIFKGERDRFKDLDDHKTHKHIRGNQAWTPADLDKEYHMQ